LSKKDPGRWVFETEPGVLVPARVLRPEKAAKQTPLVLYIGDGKDAAAAPGGRLAGLAAEGHTVIALDLRGTGETAPRKLASDRPNYFGADDKEAFLSLHLSRPLLGQRVVDVLAVVERLAREEDF